MWDGSLGEVGPAGAGEARGALPNTAPRAPARFFPARCLGAGCDSPVVPYCPPHALLARLSTDGDDWAQREQEWREQP